MNSPHLNSEQVSAWIAGDRPDRLAAHLEFCAECKARISQFESLTGAFRGRIHEVASRGRIPPFQPGRNTSYVARLALAGAFAALLLAVPIYRTQHQTPAPAVPALVAEISDTALLQQVDAQLSRGVPGSMEPLTALVWSPQELNASASTQSAIESRQSQ